MKKLIVLSFVFIISIVAFAAKIFHEDVYSADTKQSKLEWYAQKVTGKHNGTIMLSAGEIKNNHGNISGMFEIDMTTIADSDLEDAGKKTKLETHLKSADFFDVTKYPKSKFVITSVTPIAGSAADGNTHNIKGNLTIKDKTNEISFPAAVTMSPEKITCVGSAIVDRAKFDIRYGSKTFYEDIGDKMIYDEFTLKFNVVANKK